MTSQACEEQCDSGQMGQMVRLDQAVGLVLANDVTEIIPGKSKGPAFRKGHIVSAGDLQRFARLGKRHLYVLDIPPGHLHENDAAELMANALGGVGVIKAGPPVEGKITLVAQRDGLFEVDTRRLKLFNMVPDVMCASIHRHTPVKAGQPLAGTRAIPLVIKEHYVAEACAIAGQAGGLLRIMALRRCRAGIVVTGNEVASGLIEDRFAPIVRDKIEHFGGTVLEPRIVPDDRMTVALAIKSLMRQGADLIITTAGMSVDPDDITRSAIADAGGHDLLYGTPVLPGAMFLLGKLKKPGGSIPVLGVPACALFHRATVLDLLLPRVLAGENLTREDLAGLGHGGYCHDCPDGCRFPSCGFGKGT
jgi:molybdenum cofactor synthesis domain-containing protein